MSRQPIVASLPSVRRLAVAKQQLSGKLPTRPGRSQILSVVRELAYVQWDPVTTVAPSHLLTLWARLGGFRTADLDRLLWEEKQVFLHWTPLASIVLSEDYPLYASLMSRYPDSLGSAWGSHRVRTRKYLIEHAGLRKRILRKLESGPLPLSGFEEHARSRRSEGEWGFGSDVSLMLFHLLMSGDVMVVGHEGNQNLWGLTDQFLPEWVERKPLSESEFEREAAQRAIRALGTATPTEIKYHYVRGRYENLRATLAKLIDDARIHRVRVDELGSRDERYVHDLDLAALESTESSTWRPRLSLLPPFDNMVHDTARTRRLFGFHYVREQFLPKEKRRFGTYVLPILWGERFIGRIDPRFDRVRRELVVNAVHAEPDAPRDREAGERLGETIARLATFLGATRVTYPPRVPGVWKSGLG